MTTRPNVEASGLISFKNYSGKYQKELGTKCRIVEPMYVIMLSYAELFK